MRLYRSLFVLSLSCALLGAVPSLAYAYSEITALSFTSATEGYAGGGGGFSQRAGFVARTTDGGYTWSSRRIKSRYIRGLNAAGTAAYAVSDYYSSVLMTGDSGATWAPSAGRTAGYASLFDVVKLSNGTLVTAGQRHETSNGELAFISTSANNGGIWTKRLDGPIYPPTNEFETPMTLAAIADLDLAPGGAIWAAGNEWKPASGSAGSRITYKQRLIYRSTDNGATWVKQTIPSQASARAVGCVEAADDSTVFVFAENAQFLKTINGGGTWTASSMPGISGVREINPRAADSLDANRVVFVGDIGYPRYTALIGYTPDGGANWTYTQIPGAGSLRSVRMLTETHWIAVGANEAILHTVDGGVTWTGNLASVAPTVGMSTPRPGFAVGVAPVTVSGVASDTGIGVAAVDVRIRRADGRFYNGSGWVSAETWLEASTTDDWRTWTYTWTPDAATVASKMQVTVTAAAYDGAGNRSVFRAATSFGKTYASLTAPAGLPSTMRRSRAYAFTGYLRPQHAVGSYAIVLQCYRYERQANGRYAWKLRKNVYAKAKAGQKYGGSLSLPYAGKWRIRAYHRPDTLHLGTYSTMRSVTVR